MTKEQGRINYFLTGLGLSDYIKTSLILVFKID